MDKKLFNKLFPFDMLTDGLERLYTSMPWADIVRLDAIVKHYSVSGMVAVEIGSWTGFSTCIIGYHVMDNKGKLFSIDSFEGLPGQPNSKEDIKEILKGNLSRCGIESTILEGSSDNFVDTFPDNSIDFVFIDGDHRYSQVSKDIKNWLPKVKEGGILSGHDYDGTKYDEKYLEEDYVDKKHHGVSKAVGELAKEHVVKCFSKGTDLISTIWFTVKQTGVLGDQQGQEVLSPPEVQIADSEKEGRENGKRTIEEGVAATYLERSGEGHAVGSEEGLACGST